MQEDQPDPRAELAEKHSGFARFILGGIQGKHVYQGTVPPGVVQDRRAKNRQARQSRRVNRGR